MSNMQHGLRALIAGAALAAIPTIAAAQATPTKVAPKAAAGTLAAEASSEVAAPAAKTHVASSIPTQITISREVFDYASTGRRDPYKSLMTSSQVRPLLSDLHLTAIAFDPDGNNSVAILRDNITKEQHRVKVGQQLGRLRVSSIKANLVVFSIDEFGFNRQETLQMRSDTTKSRTP
jgi:ribosomal protein S12 methylthiotransferase accessory factor YcaO